MAVAKIAKSQTDNELLLKLNEIIDALGIKSLSVNGNVITWVDKDDNSQEVKMHSVKLITH